MINQKNTGKATSIPTALGYGTMVSLICTTLLIFLLAKLVDSETVAEGKIGYGITFVLILSSLMGSLVACSKTKQKMLQTSVLNGLFYLAILFGITALFFGGQYSGVGPTIILVMGGSVGAALIYSHGYRGKKHSKAKIKNR